jgi:hypothetical protein
MNQVTGNTTDSVEKYYTDGTGRVVRVDTYAGIRGAWSPELNKPVPNVTYNVVAKVDGGLENTFTYTTDAAGHAHRVSGRITSTFAGNMNRNAWQQLLAGSEWAGPLTKAGIQRLPSLVLPENGSACSPSTNTRTAEPVHRTLMTMASPSTKWRTKSGARLRIVWNRGSP